MNSEVFDVKEALRMERECKNFPEHLVRVNDLSSFPGTYKNNDGQNKGLVEIWASRYFFVRIFRHYDNTQRLSIHRTKFITEQCKWVDGITWDEIQDIKRQCGRGGRRAYEIFPEDDNIINNGNYRHIWIPSDPNTFPEMLNHTRKFLNTGNDPGSPWEILKDPSWI
jgi:hypothetical protein